MAMSLHDFVNNYVHQDDPEKDVCCAQCKQPLRDALTGCHRTSSGYECDDCYFEGLGKLIEQSPIRTPYGRRG